MAWILVAALACYGSSCYPLGLDGRRYENEAACLEAAVTAAHDHKETRLHDTTFFWMDIDCRKE